MCASTYRESLGVHAPLDQRDAYRQFAAVKVAVLLGWVRESQAGLATRCRKEEEEEGEEPGEGGQTRISDISCRMLTAVLAEACLFSS